MVASSSALGGGGCLKAMRANPTLALLRRCSWRAECLLKARGSFRTVLWLTERADGTLAQFESRCDAPLEATDGEVLDVLANEMGADFAHDGVVRFAVAYAATAITVVTSLAREPLRRRCECVPSGGHDGEGGHWRAGREIIRPPGRVPVLGALSAIEPAHDSRYAGLLTRVTLALP